MLPIIMQKQQQQQQQQPCSDESSSSCARSSGNRLGQETVYVKTLGPYDVLLGRGTGPSMNEGNVHFRKAVEERKEAYMSTPSRKEKKEIVQQTVRAIQNNNGRFLNRLTKRDIKRLGLSVNSDTAIDVYEVVSDDMAMEKTKQAIRYIRYKKDVPPLTDVVTEGVNEDSEGHTKRAISEEEEEEDSSKEIISEHRRKRRKEDSSRRSSQDVKARRPQDNGIRRPVLTGSLVSPPQSPDQRMTGTDSDTRRTVSTATITSKSSPARTKRFLQSMASRSIKTQQSLPQKHSSVLTSCSLLAPPNPSPPYITSRSHQQMMLHRLRPTLNNAATSLFPQFSPASQGMPSPQELQLLSRLNHVRHEIPLGGVLPSVNVLGRSAGIHHLLPSVRLSRTMLPVINNARGGRSSSLGPTRLSAAEAKSVYETLHKRRITMSQEGGSDGGQQSSPLRRGRCGRTPLVAQQKQQQQIVEAVLGKYLQRRTTATSTGAGAVGSAGGG